MTKPTTTMINLEDAQRFAAMAHACGIVKGDKAGAIAEATIVQQYGAELGIGPMSALDGIRIDRGKLTMKAALMAALIDRSDAVQYVTQRLDAEACVLVFSRRMGQGWEVIGTSEFGTADAEAAGLLDGPNKHNWNKYRRNMLFARAISNGAKWYCSGVFAGAVYVPEEFDVVEDAADVEPPPLDAEPGGGLKLPGPLEPTMGKGALPPVPIQCTHPLSKCTHPLSKRRRQASKGEADHCGECGEVMPKLLERPTAAQAQRLAEYMVNPACGMLAEDIAAAILKDEQAKLTQKAAGAIIGKCKRLIKGYAAASDVPFDDPPPHGEAADAVNDDTPADDGENYDDIPFGDGGDSEDPMAGLVATIHALGKAHRELRPGAGKALDAEEHGELSIGQAQAFVDKCTRWLAQRAERTAAGG